LAKQRKPEVTMSVHQKLSTCLALATIAALASMSWVSLALAQAEGDGDGLDGDELSLPNIVGAGIVTFVGWMIIRGRSLRSS
jgi:hypothetical protein